MNRIQFEIMGEPFGKQRPRVVTTNGYARAYTPEKTIRYENKVLNAYLESVKDTPNEHIIPFENEPLFCTIQATFGLSKGDYGKKGLNKHGRNKLDTYFCDKHLDSDNIAKVIQDALNGVAYKDDKQICGLLVIKAWGEMPSVKVTLENCPKGVEHGETPK